MNAFRTMLGGRGSYPHQKTRMVALRKSEEPLQKDCPVKLSLARNRNPTSNRAGSAKKGGRGSRRRSGSPPSEHKSACNGVTVRTTDINVAP